jgi:hypothetical protein
MVMVWLRMSPSSRCSGALRASDEEAAGGTDSQRPIGLDEPREGVAMSCIHGVSSHHRNRTCCDARRPGPTDRGGEVGVTPRAA